MTSRHEARLIVPDIHHKVGLVDRIRDKHSGVAAIFLGDYFDDFYDTTAHMEVTCRWLKQAIQRESDTTRTRHISAWEPLFRLSLI
ncbi:MAG TPA: hypothetical protein VHZ55_12070 [Bryobacteraceae bacterium]|jgi:hypothetical protein|nr:hypothetical protein [Bryobacteraceae bacterium]